MLNILHRTIKWGACLSEKKKTCRVSYAIGTGILNAMSSPGYDYKCPIINAINNPI